MAVIRRALVTGAARGLGAAVASVLAERGIEVWLADVDPTGLAATVQSICQAGGRAHPLFVDLGAVDAVHALFTDLERTTGGMDLVLANGAITGARAGMAVTECPWPVARDTLTVNVTGAAATLWPFVAPMVQRGHGRLGLMASVSALCPNPRTPAYGASKAAVAYLARSMDIALRPHGVTVTAIYPGFVATPGTAEIEDAMPFLMRQDVAAGRLVRALLAGRRQVRFPRRLFALFALIRLLPDVLYDPAARRLTASRPGGR